MSTGRRKSSLEEIGISHFTTLMQATNHSNPIKIALNGSIGLEVNIQLRNNRRERDLLIPSLLTSIICHFQVTPPEEPLPVLGVPCISGGGSGGGVNPSVFGGSSLGISGTCSDSISSLQVPSGGGSRDRDRDRDRDDGPSSSSAGPSPRHHLQGTIV